MEPEFEPLLTNIMAIDMANAIVEGLGTSMPEFVIIEDGVAISCRLPEPTTMRRPLQLPRNQNSGQVTAPRVPKPVPKPVRTSAADHNDRAASLSLPARHTFNDAVNAVRSCMHACAETWAARSRADPSAVVSRQTAKVLWHAWSLVCRYMYDDEDVKHTVGVDPAHNVLSPSTALGILLLRSDAAVVGFATALFECVCCMQTSECGHPDGACVCPSAMCNRP